MQLLILVTLFVVNPRSRSSTWANMEISFAGKRALVTGAGKGKGHKQSRCVQVHATFRRVFLFPWQLKRNDPLSFPFVEATWSCAASCWVRAAALVLLSPCLFAALSQYLRHGVLQVSSSSSASEQYRFLFPSDTEKHRQQGLTIRYSCFVQKFNTFREFTCFL